MQLPPDVADIERIVRVIKSPYHVNKSKTALKKNAFFPPAGRRELSVIRQAMGEDFCKDKGVEIVAPEATAQYLGLAVGITGIVRALGAAVEDYRADFLGHAHIITEHPRVAEEPLPAAVSARLNELFDALVRHFELHIDPAPAMPGWPGPPLDGTKSEGS